MRARLALFVIAASLIITEVAACGGSPAGDSQPTPCTSTRFDLHRFTDPCLAPPPASGGEWTMEYLYPDAPAGLRERFCAYTWTPTSSTANCAAPPTATISRADSDQLMPRGHCPLTQPGCGATMAQNGLPPPPTTTTCSPDGTCSTTQAISSVGCCDACVEIADGRAYVVLPPNQSFDSVYFNVSKHGGRASELVQVYNAPTSVIAVQLKDTPASYDPGVVLQMHYSPP